MKIAIDYISKQAIAEYCHVNISPRRYYLHNKIGGSGWSIYGEIKPVEQESPNWKVQATYWYLDVDSEHQATIIRLKYGV
jgi:hypothetical protein